MPKMTAAQEAAYALNFNIARGELGLAVQLEYDRLLGKLAPAQAQSAAGLNCSKCGDKLTPIARYCPSCGQPANTEAAVPLPNDAKTLDKAKTRALRDLLKGRLGRDVSVPGEGPLKKAARVATNPYLVLGAATVGIGVATVLTAGTVHVVLGAVGAGQMSSNGSKAVDWWKSKKRGTVYLDRGAVEYLLALKAKSPQEKGELQVNGVQAVLSASPSGEVYITRQQLVEASKSPRSALRMSQAGLRRLVSALRSRYGLTGLALLSAGLFLAAVTVIPEYIRDPSLRVAAVASIIGGILIAIAIIETFRDALADSSDLEVNACTPT